MRKEYRLRRNYSDAGTTDWQMHLYVDLDSVRERVSRQEVRQSARERDSFLGDLHAFCSRRQEGMSAWMGRVHKEGRNTPVAARGNARSLNNG